ncbi:MAG: hypothetical protein ACREXO_01565 [Advenella sp.]
MRHDNMCWQCTVTGALLAAGLLALPADGAILDFFDCNGEREGIVQAIASSSKTGGLAKNSDIYICMRKQIN